MKLLISALEPSANLHLSPLLQKLDAQIVGVFDERFGNPLIPSSEFSIMGIVDVLPKIVKAKRAIAQMAQLSLTCNKVLLIDSPAFNIPLAKAIKEINPHITIIYYILPKVWAWKPERAKKVEKYCDILASIFPFEKAYYPKATYVGNPLLDEIPAYKQSYEPSGYIAYLPGSRKSEIKALLPIYKELATKIKKNSILVIPPHFSSQEIQEIYGDISEFAISRNTHKTFLKAEFAFVCSGTATLEAALIGVPFVLAYKAKRLDYFLGKMFVKLSHVGLANILFDFASMDALHEEFLQQQANSNNLLDAYFQIDRELFFTQALTLRKMLAHGSCESMLKLISL
ncbi:MAG: lipid-A-disaccharide synthase [Sulfurospirillum sp.]|nr:lipid-A-disaccharide synthase [Sulfurospirillum sp.]